MRVSTLLLKIAAIFLTLALLIVIFVTLQWQQMLPDESQNVEIAVLEEDAGIRIDSLGVAHLSAESEKDLLITWGYHTAADRLWEIEHLRMAAQGRLSEHYGAETRELDLLFRHFRFTELAAAKLSQLPEESRQYLEWYVAGLNACLSEYQDDLPTVFKVNDRKPVFWHSVEVLEIQQFVAWCLDESWEIDFIVHQLADQLPEGLTASFLAAWGVAMADNERPHYQSMKELWRQKQAFRRWWGMPSRTPAYSAVVDGRHAGLSGYLINANPLSGRLPFRWQNIHLQSAGAEASGLAIPGVPGLLAGRNMEIAWGVLPGAGRLRWMQLRVDPVSYRYRDGDGQWQPIKLMRDTLDVSGRDHEYIIYETPYGRIVNLHTEQIFDSTALVVEWQDAIAGDETAALMLLMQAENRAAFQRAVDKFQTPSLRFLYSDRQGYAGVVNAGPPVTAASPGNERYLFESVREPALKSFFPDSQGVILPGLEKGLDLSVAMYDRQTIGRFAGSGIPEYASTVRVMPPLLNWLKLVDLAQYQTLLADIEDVVFVLTEWDNNPGDDYLATCILALWQAVLTRNLLGEQMSPEQFARLVEYPQFYQGLVLNLLDNAAENEEVAAWELQRDRLIADSFVGGLQILKKYLGTGIHRWELHRLYDVDEFRRQEPFLDRLILHYIMRGPEAAGSRSDDFFPVPREHPVYRAGQSTVWAVDWDSDDRYGFWLSNPWSMGPLSTAGVRNSEEKAAVRSACFCQADAGKSVLIYRLRSGSKK